LWLSFASKQAPDREGHHRSRTDFGNRTGDAIFDDTLKTALNIPLWQSPFLNVLPESQVAKTLQLMTVPPARNSRSNWLVSFAGGPAAKPTLPERSAAWAANMCWN
jgi:hypothetical protein